MREVIYGVQSRASVRLSEIARALEEGIGLKNVVERLGRQLNRKDLRVRVRRNLLKLAASRVGRETLLVVDLTDVSKPYAARWSIWPECGMALGESCETGTGVARWWAWSGTAPR